MPPLQPCTSPCCPPPPPLTSRVLRPLLLLVVELTIGDKVFYTRSTRLRGRAKVVGHFDEGYVELEFHQDGVPVVNRQCPIDSTSFGISSLDSPCHLWKSLPMSLVMRVMAALFRGNVV